MKKQFLRQVSSFVLLLGLFGPVPIMAQVTIGSSYRPLQGALLDLKEKESINGEENSIKRLMLPRVELLTTKPASGKLAASIKNTRTWSETSHVGLLVYNAVSALDACSFGTYPGVYVWSGNEWLSLYQKKASFPKTEISSDDYDGANAYIAELNSNLNIPIKRAFDIWNDYVGNTESNGKVLNLVDVNNLSGALTANVAWQESGTINSVSVSGTGSVANLVVATGSSEGNALVQVDIAGKVLWQWHIWVTRFNPSEKAHPYVVNGKTNWYMDRFLGATADKGDAAYGLFYQWGRNVPMPRNGVLDTVNAKSTSKDNLTVAIQTDKFIVYNTTASHDWYSDAPRTWDTRWGDLSNGNTKKSPFDPCPKGWRLPSGDGDKSAFECLDLSSQSGDNGWDFNEDSRNLGYFPLGGYRANSNGDLADQGIAGYVWTATPSKIMASALYYNATEINSSDQCNRANALNVRCLKDK